MAPNTAISVQPSNSPTGPTRVALAGRIDIAHVGDLYRAAVEMARQDRDVVVCCRDAEYLHPAAVQIVLSLGRELEVRGHGCELADVRGRVRDDLALLGLGHVLGND